MDRCAAICGLTAVGAVGSVLARRDFRVRAVSSEPQQDPEDVSFVTANLADVNARICAKCTALGRAKPVLVAVSKTKPLEYVTAALAAGQNDFGENYIQELAEKSAALAGDKMVRWHYIGQLQSNKVKVLAACPNLAMVHTLPSQKTANKLSAACEELRPGNPLAVLVQVRLSLVRLLAAGIKACDSLQTVWCCR